MNLKISALLSYILVFAISVFLYEAASACTGIVLKAEDGAELTSLVSIMLGAIKELDRKMEKLNV